MSTGFIKGDVNWGIIGCGDVCEVKSGPALYKVPNSRLVAVMRRNAAKANDFAKRHGASRSYDNVNQLVNDKDVNAVYIATPPASHEEYAILAMQARKPVYIEKPVTLDSESCKRLIIASQQHNIPAVCAHYRRALPLFKHVKSIIEEGVLGRVILISLRLLQSPSKNVIAQTEENWRIDPTISGGGLFHDLAPHQLDILYWIFGAPVTMRGGSLIQDERSEVPETTSLEVVFNDRIFFQGLWSFSVGQTAVEDSCRIIGENGYVNFSFFGGTVLELALNGKTESMKFDVPAHIQQPMINHVVRYFRGEADNPCSLKEALFTMNMMDCTR